MIYMWTSKPDTEALSNLEELCIGPYLLRVWKFKANDSMGFNVECNKKWIDGKVTNSPKEDAVKAAVAHCCSLMAQLQQRL